jgi:acyl dehydratase
LKTGGLLVKVFDSLAEFTAAVGTEIGPGEWLEIDQDRVNTFADATGDHQWIHVDVEKAKAGPFGGPIAHGLLTLSLVPLLTHDLYRVDGIKMGVNYGYNKVRFITPVPVGSKLRATAKIAEIIEVPGGIQATVGCTVEIDGAPKPACVVESIVRYLA